VGDTGKLVEAPLDVHHQVKPSMVTQWFRGHENQVVEFIQMNLEDCGVPVLGGPQMAKAPIRDVYIQAESVISQETPALLGVNEAEPTAPELVRHVIDCMPGFFFKYMFNTRVKNANSYYLLLIINSNLRIINL
jgi:hypothetical protein